jgi:hypothetical protein
MEIITTFAGICFWLFLAALAVVPTALSAYLERRAANNADEADRSGGRKVDGPRELEVYPPAIPFNYPQLAGRRAPGVAKL